MATNFELQTNLTTQIMNFTGETRTKIVLEIYKKTREIHGIDFSVAQTIPVVTDMLNEEIELFIFENPEFFESDVDSDDENGYTDIFSDPDFAHDSL
jgi:hypothetical protein